MIRSDRAAALNWLSRHGYDPAQPTLEIVPGSIGPKGWRVAYRTMPPTSSEQIVVADALLAVVARDQPEILWWVRPTNWIGDSIVVGLGESLYAAHGLDATAFGDGGLLLRPEQFLVGAQLMLLSQIGEWEASWFGATNACIVRSQKDGYLYVLSSGVEAIQAVGKLGFQPINPPTA